MEANTKTDLKVQQKLALHLLPPQPRPGLNNPWKRILKDIDMVHTTNSLINSLACIDGLDKERTRQKRNWEGEVRGHLSGESAILVDSW